MPGRAWPNEATADRAVKKERRMMAKGQWLKLMETGDMIARGKPPAIYGQLHLTVPFRYEVWFLNWLHSCASPFLRRGNHGVE